MKTALLTEETLVQPSPHRLEKISTSGESLFGDRNSASAIYDLVCFSHLRWDFVFQRPQHLLSRFARERRVFYIEEPVFEAQGEGRLELRRRPEGVWVAVPHLPEGLSDTEVCSAQRALLGALFAERGIHDFVLWYYTPMALPFSSHLFSDHLEPLATVYDCMDELSSFRGAPTALGQLEGELLARADLVFAGGRSLYEAKRQQHRSVHAFPSSIDYAHFARARAPLGEPADQAGIPYPRLGFYGVIDERLNLDLLAGLAAARPAWQLVMVGPVVKIDPESLPRGANLHYLGGKTYGELPGYLAGWDAALLPFARNASTRFISPTKTPEYLAAGKPVVSTPIRDVVNPYGQRGLVRIADTVAGFVAAVEAALADPDREAWLERVDTFLAQTSWDHTWAEMARLISERVSGRRALFAEVDAGATPQASAHGSD